MATLINCRYSYRSDKLPGRRSLCKLCQIFIHIIPSSNIRSMIVFLFHYQQSATNRPISCWQLPSLVEAKVPVKMIYFLLVAAFIILNLPCDQALLINKPGKQTWINCLHTFLCYSEMMIMKKHFGACGNKNIRHAETFLVNYTILFSLFCIRFIYYKNCLNSTRTSQA